MKLVYFVAVQLLFTLSVLANKPCVRKKFGQDLIVCVCNATYCDTVDPVPALANGQFVQYTSNAEGLRLERTFGAFNKTPHNHGPKMTVNENVKYQTMVGFGGAFTDAAGINIKSLSFQSQENLLKSYFSPEGIEINMGRVPIAGCDFSTRGYSYDDVDGDINLEHFNLTEDDYIYKIPLIQRAIAMSRRPIRLMAAAWSAPPWMKDSHSYIGVGILIEKYYEAWANYHIKFLDAYEKEGIKFWSVSTGNEPSNGLVTVIPLSAMGWTLEMQMKWISKYFGPAMKNSRHKDTLIITIDDQRFMLFWWSLGMLGYPSAVKYIDGLAVHWYYDKIWPVIVSDVAHTIWPNKFLIMSEASAGFHPLTHPKVLLGSWHRGELYMESILENLGHWSVGWVDWNLALNATGGPNWLENFVDAVVIVNPEKDEFYKQPMFYTMGHFAKFVPEGSVRISITQKPDSYELYSMAFKTPDSATVIVLHNKRMTQRLLTITDPNKGHINLLLSKKSIQTIIY